MRKIDFSAACILAVTLIMGGLCAGAALFMSFDGRGGTVVHTPGEGSLPDAGAAEDAAVLMLQEEQELAMLPAPTPVITVPAGAADVWAGGKLRLCLEDGADAAAFFTEYLTGFLTDSSGAEGTERVLSAEYEEPLQFLPASGHLPALSRKEALAAMEQDPSLIPVRTVSECRQTRITAGFDTKAAADETLPAGTRVVAQLGAEERTVTMKTVTRLGGDLLGTSEERVLYTRGSRDTILRVGAMEAPEPEEQKGKTGKNDKAGKKEQAAKDETPAPALEGFTLRMPTEGGKAGKGFGMTGSAMHCGLDLSAEKGAALYAPAEGVVVFCGERGSYGFVIEIDHGNRLISRLSGCAEAAVQLNQRVFAGDRIAVLSAHYGESPYLHYELLLDRIPTDPSIYMK